MIEVIKFEPISELPGTYGYISLGSFKCDIHASGVINFYYKATCKIKEKYFDLIILKTGSLLDLHATVLGDLTNIPGNLLLDCEDLFNILKNFIKQDEPVWENDLKIEYIYDTNAESLLS